MLINKYIEEASETELLSYKLVLSSQIIEAQKSLDLIENAQKKLEGHKAQFLKDIDPATVPANLIIRMSSHMVDQGPVKFWPWTSTVTSKGGATCPAPKQGGKCKDCRACWTRSIANINYGKH